jgi:hypothetical protein
MPETTDDSRGDSTPNSAQDETVRAVTVRQGGARSISAERVEIRQGAAGSVQTGRLRVIQGGIGLASAKRIRVTAGTVGVALGDRAVFEQAMTSVAVARERISLDQSAAGVLLGKSVTARDSAIGLVVTPHLEGTNVRVLMGPQAALAFGAGVGLVLALARFLGRR